MGVLFIGCDSRTSWYRKEIWRRWKLENRKCQRSRKTTALRNTKAGHPGGYGNRFILSLFWEMGHDPKDPKADRIVPFQRSFAPGLPHWLRKFSRKRILTLRHQILPSGTSGWSILASICPGSMDRVLVGMALSAKSNDSYRVYTFRRRDPIQVWESLQCLQERNWTIL